MLSLAHDHHNPAATQVTEMVTLGEEHVRRLLRSGQIRASLLAAGWVDEFQ